MIFVIDVNIYNIRTFSTLRIQKESNYLSINKIKTNAKTFCNIIPVMKNISIHFRSMYGISRLAAYYPFRIISTFPVLKI